MASDGQDKCCSGQGHCSKNGGGRARVRKKGKGERKRGRGFEGRRGRVKDGARAGEGTTQGEGVRVRVCDAG